MVWQVFVGDEMVDESHQTEVLLGVVEGRVLLHLSCVTSQVLSPVLFQQSLFQFIYLSLFFSTCFAI